MAVICSSSIRFLLLVFHHERNKIESRRRMNGTQGVVLKPANLCWRAVRTIEKTVSNVTDHAADMVIPWQQVTTSFVVVGQEARIALVGWLRAV